MDRHLAILGSYKYLIENYNAEIDLQNNYYSAEFVMIRNFTIMNNLICDHDIYIIEKKYFNEYIEELKESGTTSGKKIAFPITGSNVNSYSNSYTKFNFSMSTINNESIYYVDENNNTHFGTDVYEIYEKSQNKLIPKKIKCNKLRIYHPLTRKSINALIDINNFINNIHFHYLCKSINDYSSQSETEIKYCNETYSEYIDIYYPNIEDIFKINIDGSYSSFYIEDLEIVASTYNNKFINSIMSDSKDLEQCEEYEGKQIVPMNLLIQPYRIIEEYNSNNALNYDNDLSNDDKIFVKLYLKTAVSIENNYIVYPINATIFPYSEIDDTINMYILNDYAHTVTISFNTPCHFKLMSRMGFSDGTISIVTMFDYPNKSYFYNLYKDDKTTSPVLEAYKYYYNVTDNNYKMFTNDNILKQLEEIDNVETLSESAIKYTKETLSLPDNIDKNKVLEMWKNIMKETLIKEYEEEFGTPGNFIGFKLEIATDAKFKNIIYDKNYRINFHDLDDFAFKLNGIFKSWNQKPEQLIARAVFYDRILGFKITGNLIIISNEWFKYMVNDNVKGRMTELSIINKNKGLINKDMKVIELKDDNINFINTVNCVVSKKYESGNIDSSLNNNQKIIFKPIFYRTSDLQNIRIRSNVTQNIGINLMKYMTKIDTFKMKIDDIEYIETSRNDAYVIFKINAANLKSTSGRYDITNQDDEFISSGAYILY